MDTPSHLLQLGVALHDGGLLLHGVGAALGKAAVARRSSTLLLVLGWLAPLQVSS